MLPEFRDQLIAAPLKPAQLTGREIGGEVIPRSTDRGPIEAMAAFASRPTRSQFRDQLIAAPLKHGLRAVSKPAWGEFRDQLIAAPLKQISWARIGSRLPNSAIN